MEGDLVEIEGEIVNVISVEDDATGDNYTVVYRNDYDEKNEFNCNYEHMFRLYVFVEKE
jgi:hypothetical protein